MRSFAPSLSAAMTFTVLATSAAADTSAPMSWPAVNGTTLRCEPPPARTKEQLARQFDTAPRDLDQMSQMAAKFMNPSAPEGAAFRKRRDEMFANDWAYLCRYREANAALKQAGAPRPAAVFMGDSITEGWIEADPAFFSNGDYIDRGISGQSSAQMLARFPVDVIALRPRVVHIMAGTNDIGGATGPLTADEYAANIRAMVDLARANGIHVVLAALPPMSRLLPRPDFDVRPVVRMLNSRLRQIAADTHSGFVDYYTPLATADGAFDPRFANDGVHPTRAGYAVMAPLAKRALDQAARRKP